MTYSTCRIDSLIPIEVPALPHIKYSRQELVHDLETPIPSGHYWLPLVREWAEANKREVFFKDNCWIEIELSAEELRKFLRDTYDPDHSMAQALSASLDTDNRYVLEAEEF